MKGLSLPINVLVIVVVAVIVLLGVVALYFGGFSPFSASIGVEGAKNDACGRLVRMGCNDETRTFLVTDFDANMNGVIGNGNGWTWNPLPTCGTGINAATYGDNLAALCYCFYGRTTEASCKQLCGCP